MDNNDILYENGMLAAFLTVAMFPFVSQNVFHDEVLDDPRDIPVSLYLDLFSRFERLNKPTL